MSGNPNSPGYEPPGYSAGAPHGGHGHGSEFGADLYDLYQAGRLYFPETAGTYAAVGTSLATCEGGLENVASMLQNPAPTVGMEALHDELQTAVRSMTGLLERLGETFVTMATDFQRTDEAASASFRRLYDADKTTGAYDVPTPTVTLPPAPDGLHPTAPALPGA